ncbi:MAG: hypothetical protein NTU81_03370 [Candidatus Nomurabacteria bacterium]|nr:hypothetical protein [Candidatus Nomurabacteria bacterium]
MQKYSLDLYLECGKDITECKNANICLPSDRECSIMYCNPNTKGDICSTEMDKIKNNFPDDVILPFNSDNNL